MIDNKQVHWYYGGARRKLVPWTVVDATLGLALVAAGAAVMIVGLAWNYRGDAAALNDWLVSASIALPHVIMVLAVWLLGVRKYAVTWRTVGFARPRRRLSMLLPWLALVASLGFSGLYVAVITALKVDALLPPPLPVDLLGQGAVKALNVAMIGIVGPLVEEMFFRGFLLVALVHPLGTVGAAVVGSAIFAVSHVNAGVMVPFFVSGLLLSWLYLTTRSLWPPLIAHAAQNLLALSVAA